LPSDLRDRKGHAADRARHAVAVRNQLAGGGVALGSVVDALGGGGAAVGRIDQHLVVRVLPEQGLVTLGELRGVLGQVGRVDGEEWLVVRVRIRVVIAGMVVGKAGFGGGLEAPGPGDHYPDPYANDKDRKSTRLNSSHVAISYAVVCLKKKTLPG